MPKFHVRSLGGDSLLKVSRRMRSNMNCPNEMTVIFILQNFSTRKDVWGQSS